MALRWKYETWRKLYVRETGTFAALSFYARCLARELLAMCDDEGLIHLGGKDPATAIGFQGGAATGERRMLRKHVDELLADGYLELVGDALRIRNFMPAQQGVDRVPEAPLPKRETPPKPERTENELDTNRERTEHEPETNQERTANELKTKSDSSAENSNGTQVALIPSLPSLPEREKEFSRQVIGYLNEKVGRGFEPDGASVMANVRKLVRAGRTVEQAKAVIDAKYAEWARNPEMARQLKPSVLLRPGNFQRYLDEDVGAAPPAQEVQHPSVLAVQGARLRFE